MVVRVLRRWEDMPAARVRPHASEMHSAQLPVNNPIVGGRWTPEEKDAVSVEEGLAETLGLKLGDRLGFDIAGVQVIGLGIGTLRPTFTFGAAAGITLMTTGSAFSAF